MSHPSIQEIAQITADLSARFIAHDPSAELRRQFDKILYKRRADLYAGRMPEARGIAVIGNSGSGKTTAVERLITTHPDLNLGQDGSPTCEVVSVRVPSPATLKSVGITTLAALGFPLERNKTSHQIWSLVQTYAQMRGTLFVHYDEAQDFVSSSNGKEIEDVLKTIKSFMQNREWSVGLILSGTPPLRAMLNLDTQLTRRFKPIELPRVSYTGHAPEIWATLNAYAKLTDLKLKKDIDKGDFLRRLMHASTYEFGTTIEMIISAIEEALLEGRKTLTRSDFAEAFRSRAACVDALNPIVANDYKSIDASKILLEDDVQSQSTFASEIKKYRKMEAA
jgi:Cdc6-like AAA superfamily ATPase